MRWRKRNASCLQGIDLSRQLSQTAEGIPLLLPTGEQLVEDAGVGLAGRVQQHDRAVVDARQQLGEGVLLGRLVVGVPCLLYTSTGDHLHIYLNTLAGIGHLLVLLWLVG